MNPWRGEFMLMNLYFSDIRCEGNTCNTCYSKEVAEKWHSQNKVGQILAKLKANM